MKIGENCTAQKMKISIKDFFSKCDQICYFFADCVTFTKGIVNGKLHCFGNNVHFAFSQKMLTRKFQYI